MAAGGQLVKGHKECIGTKLQALRGQSEGAIYLRRKTAAGPGDRGAGGASLLKTRPQCLRPVLPLTQAFLHAGVCVWTPRPRPGDPLPHSGS